MHALIYLCEHFNLHDQAAYWRAVLQMDQFQRRRLVEIVMNHIRSFKGKRAAVLGFAYKASTSDVRGSPSLDLIRSLLQEGASVYIYDPRVAAEDVMKACDHHRDVHVAGVNTLFSFRKILSLRVKRSADVRSITDAVRHSDCVIVCTDWDEFKSIDWHLMASEMQVLFLVTSIPIC
jgi:UDPglucose 6-dehydrogenase